MLILLSHKTTISSKNTKQLIYHYLQNNHNIIAINHYLIKQTTKQIPDNANDIVVLLNAINQKMMKQKLFQSYTQMKTIPVLYQTHKYKYLNLIKYILQKYPTNITNKYHYVIIQWSNQKTYKTMFINSVDKYMLLH